MGYCNPSGNVIAFNQSQCDHNKGLLLYLPDEIDRDELGRHWAGTNTLQGGCHLDI